MPITNLSFVLEGESSRLKQSIPEQKEEIVQIDSDESEISKIHEGFFKEYKSHLSLYYRNEPEANQSWFNTLKVTHRLDFEDKDDSSAIEIHVICDDSLLDSLFQLYLVYGWRLIFNIERRASATNNYSLLTYFYQSLNCLVYLILKRMLSIEQKARNIVTKKATAVKELLDNIIDDQLRIRTSQGLPSRIQNKSLLNTIVQALQDAVKAKKVLADAIDKARLAKKDQGLADIIATVLAQEGNVGISPSERAKRDVYLSNVGKAQQKVDYATRLYSSSLEILKINCPYALLIVDAIEEKDLATNDKAEELLCAALMRCRELVQTDLSSLQGVSVIHETFGNLVLDKSGSPNPLPSIYFDRVKGPDRQLVSLGFKKCHEDPRWRVMISDQLFSEMGNTDAIDRQSFEYAVWGQYVTSMLIERRDIEEWDEFYKNVSQVAAVAGITIALAVLLFGSGGSASPVVGAVAAAETPMLVTGTEVLITVGQMSYAVSTVRDELRSIDTMLADKLVLNMDSASSTFAAIGALTQTRKELASQIPQDLIKTLLLSRLASVHTLAQLGVHAYGYYQDLQTMVEITDSWMPQPSDLVCR